MFPQGSTPLSAPSICLSTSRQTRWGRLSRTSPGCFGPAVRCWSTPDQIGRSATTIGPQWRALTDPTHINLRGHDAWRYELRRAGFSVAERERMGHGTLHMGTDFVTTCDLHPSRSRSWRGDSFSRQAQVRVRCLWGYGPEPPRCEPDERSRLQPGLLNVLPRDCQVVTQKPLPRLQIRSIHLDIWCAHLQEETAVNGVHHVAANVDLGSDAIRPRRQK